MQPVLVSMYHMSVTTMSRKRGQSATASAAYRRGSEITDTTTGEHHDYSRKRGVESAELVLPDDAPEWAADPAALWNAAEAAETRKNSTVAREFRVALPAELDDDQRRELALDYARELVDRHGFAADVAVHAPDRGGDERNYHAHILTTTRRLEPEGLTAKTRELDDRKTGSKIITEHREKWANLANEALEQAGADKRIDHRSLAAQGIEREPQQHQGPAVTAAERREPGSTTIGAHNQELRLLAEADEQQDANLEREVEALEDELQELEREETVADESAMQRLWRSVRQSFKDWRQGRQADQIQQRQPPPEPQESVFAGSQLELWAKRQRRALAAVVGSEAAERRVHDAAEQAGWQDWQISQAGISGPAADAAEKRQRQEQERREQRERQRQQDAERRAALAELQREHGRIINPAELAQDQHGQWQWRPDQADQPQQLDPNDPLAQIAERERQLLDQQASDGLSRAQERELAEISKTLDDHGPGGPAEGPSPGLT